MNRWLVATLVLLTVAQAAGFTAILGAACSQPCDDDDSEGRCPPTCVCLGCCSYRGPAVVGDVAAGDPIPVAWSPDTETDAFLPSPSPRPILHIPKPQVL